MTSITRSAQPNKKPKQTAVVDFMGKKLKKWDYVCFMKVGYRNLQVGRISKIGEVKITIVQPADSPGFPMKRCFQFPSQVVKMKRTNPKAVKIKNEFLDQIKFLSTQKKVAAKTRRLMEEYKKGTITPKR
jgi:hypothetical protein